MKIQRFNEHSNQSSMLDDFINSLGPIITESNSDNKYKDYQNKIIKDLKLNFSIVGTFGAGLGALYPIVDRLVNNMQLNIDLTPDRVVLLTIAAFSIVYLEEKKSKMDPKQEELLRKDCKSMLEELKMSGIGNGIVKKLTDGFKSISNIFKTIAKHTGAIVGGFIDMFAYAALSIPVLNGVMTIVGKYDLNLDSLITNFMGLAVGVGSLIAKHGIADIINRIKGINKKKVVDEIETPVIQKFGDADVDQKEGELIREDQ